MFSSLVLYLAVFIRIISNPVANVFQKQLTVAGRHPFFVNFLTYGGLVLLTIPLLVSQWQPALPLAFWSYSIAGGLTGAIGNAWLVKALQKGPLSVLGPINAYKSIVGMIVGIFLLAEIPGINGLLGMALIIFGSYFVLDATDERFSWQLFRQPAIRYRIGALILTAIEAVFVKKVMIHSTPDLAFYSWCWFGGLFSFLLLLVNRVKMQQEWKALTTPNFRQLGILVLCIGAMQWTTNYTFAHMPVSYALALFQLSAIVSVFLGHHLFQEQGLLKKLLGTLIMIAGASIIIFFKKE